MFPPVFQICTQSPDVVALLGSPITRLFMFGRAPAGVAKPYAVWQSIGGSPENYINQVPDIDSHTIQVDVYADSADSAREVAEALRDAIEPHAHVTSFGGDGRDPETKNYRYTMSIDWWVSRPQAS